MTQNLINFSLILYDFGIMLVFCIMLMQWSLSLYHLRIFSLIRAYLGYHLQMLFYYLDSKFQFYIKFFLFHFQKTQILQVRNFLISNRNKMIFMLKCS